MWLRLALIALTYACARSLRPSRFNHDKLLNGPCPWRGWARVRSEVAMACDLDELLEALSKAKDVTAAARMDCREAMKDEAKATMRRLASERDQVRAEEDEARAQRAVDKHIAQITASHLEDEPEDQITII